VIEETDEPINQAILPSNLNHTAKSTIEQAVPSPGTPTQSVPLILAPNDQFVEGDISILYTNINSNLSRKDLPHLSNLNSSDDNGKLEQQRKSIDGPYQPILKNSSSNTNYKTLQVEEHKDDGNLENTNKGH
jgi:hypothetical protein